MGKNHHDYLWTLVAVYCGEGSGTHSSTLAWRIPWTEEPAGLQQHKWFREGSGTPPVLLSGESQGRGSQLGCSNTSDSEKAVAPTPVLLPGESHGRRSLVGCSPWGREESDTTEWLAFHFSLSCTGEGNGSPLQCSCLENPRDGGTWWAAVCGVAQSRTQRKRLSSSSSLQNDWRVNF